MLRVRCLPLVALTLAVTCLSALLAAPASAATAKSLRVLTFTNDQFFNYDFRSSSASSRNVDWAVSLLFHNNAEVDRIKAVLSRAGAPYAYSGSTKRARLRDTPDAFVWDGDSGRKTGACSGPGRHTRHYRLYADSDDRVGYTPGLGYWVIGTTHIDYGECTPYAFFDDSEVTEKHLAGWAARNGARVARDHASFHNQQYGAQGNHYWNNNGRATYIRI